jgi:hypothetical protein
LKALNKSTPKQLKLLSNNAEAVASSKFPTQLGSYLEYSLHSQTNPMFSRYLAEIMPIRATIRFFMKNSSLPCLIAYFI